MRTHLPRAALAAIALASLAVPALAQNPQAPLQGRDSAPNLPPSSQTIPEKIRPGGDTTTPDTTGSTNLSDRLQKSDGVLRPNTEAVPDNTVRPPVANPNSTPVIRPGELPGQGNAQAK
jgi:hypothetical protein